MNSQQAIKYAVEYLYNQRTGDKEYPVEVFTLGRTFNYYLVTSIQRLLANEIELVKKDIYLLVEAYIMSNPDKDFLVYDAGRLSSWEQEQATMKHNPRYSKNDCAECGHPYDRHWNLHDKETDFCSCKYCGCKKFVF